MKIIPRKRCAEGEVWKDHVLARLKEPRCWICAQVVREVDRDLFWFASEQYYEPRVVDKMRLTYGFCPIHTRHFLVTGSHSVSVAVFCYLTWYAIKQLDAARILLLERDSKQDARRLCLEAAAALQPQGICPLCESLRQTETIEINALLEALANREVKEAYARSPGVCIPHLRQAGYRAEWDSFTFLTQDLQHRLEARMFPERSNTGLLEHTVGLDRESGIRRRNGAGKLDQSQANPQKREIETSIDAGKPAHPWSQTFTAAMASLAEPGCPVCIACAEGTEHYLDWLGQQMKARSSNSGNWDLSWNICPSHLWDLNAAGYEPPALLLAEHMMHDWLAKLDRLTTGLKHRPAEPLWERLYQGLLVCSGRYDPDPLENATTLRRRWGKVASVLESPRDRLNGLRSVAFRSDLCQACLQIQTTTKRRLELILRLLEDPLGRQAYQSGWGLCLRHCIEAAKLAEVPSALAELLSAQIARLRLLEWELEEASRKDNWSVRYEPKGPESDVWRRAAYQFCGV